MLVHPWLAPSSAGSPELRARQRVRAWHKIGPEERGALAELMEALDAAHDDLPAEVRSVYWRSVTVLAEAS